MKVLYIIGNGLDISLGMKTDYQSFYNYYKTIDAGDQDIEAMKLSIENGRYETWADLESGLGAYSNYVSSENVYIKCLDHLKEYLKIYLNDEFKKWKYGANHFVNDLYYPSKYLDSQIQSIYNQFVSSISNDGTIDNVKIVTLNYTNTIDHMLSYYNMKDNIDLLHIHGILNNGMVIGVNDIQQIANEKFWTNRDIVENFVKPSFNDACLNNNNSLFERWINETSIIVIFGTSMGETDRKWWRLIGKKLQDSANSAMVFFYAFDKDKDIQLHPNYRLRWTEGYQRDLLKKFEIPEDKTKQVLAKICIGINKTIFT